MRVLVVSMVLVMDLDIVGMVEDQITSYTAWLYNNCRTTVNNSMDYDGENGPDVDVEREADQQDQVNSTLLF